MADFFESFRALPFSLKLLVVWFAFVFLGLAVVVSGAFSLLGTGVALVAGCVLIFYLVEKHYRSWLVAWGLQVFMVAIFGISFVSTIFNLPFSFMAAPVVFLWGFALWLVIVIFRYINSESVREIFGVVSQINFDES